MTLWLFRLACGCDYQAGDPRPELGDERVCRQHGVSTVTKVYETRMTGPNWRRGIDY